MIGGMWERTHALGVGSAVDVKCPGKVHSSPPTLSSQT